MPCVARHTSSASGFSLNIGSVVSKELFNVEIAPGGVHSILNVTGGYSYHFNNYLRLNGTVPQFVDPSSTHRLARVLELPEPQNATGACLN